MGAIYKTTKLLFILLCLTALTSYMLHSQPVKNSEENKQSDEKIFQVVEKQPEFPGGADALKKFILQNMTLPKIVSDDKHAGKVFVSFVVNTDGSLQDTEVKRGLNLEYNLEALRIVNLMPKWKPGFQSGKAMRVRYILPLDFQ